MSDYLMLGSKKFNYRLIVGTGKYESPEIMKQCFEEIHDGSKNWNGQSSMSDLARNGAS